MVSRRAPLLRKRASKLKMSDDIFAMLLIMPFMTRLIMATRRCAMAALSVLIIFMSTLFLATAAQAQDVDWLVNITDANLSPPAGGIVPYQISVTNNGADPALATTVSVAVPATTSFVSSTGALTGCTPAPIVTGPASIVCNVPALASGGSAAMVFSVRTSVQGIITVQASVPTAGDSDTGNNVEADTTTVVAGADIGLSVTGPSTASAGSTQTYNFIATNNGPDPVSTLVFDVPVPTGFVNIAAPSGCVLAGPNYQCTVSGPIAPGGTVTRAFTGQISAASNSAVTLSASVSSVVPADPISTNNNALINTTITAGSDVSITKSRSPSGAVFVGDAVTFTLAAQYTGDTVNGIVITDTIPANYAITSAIGSGYACAVTGQVVTCTRTTGSGPGANVSLGSITVTTTAITAGTPTNTATISTTGPTDPNPANNTATDGGATITQSNADLRANKSGPNPALVVVGNSYDFDISTTNLGNRPFVGTVEMTDSLPAGLTFTGAALNGWTCSPAPTVAGPVSILCSRIYTAGAPLAVGETTPVVTLTTLVTASGALSNGLSVTSPNANFPDPDLANNTITVGVTSSVGSAAADLSVLKSAGLATLAVGDVQTFTLQIVNSGPSTSSNIAVNDDVTNLINSATGPTGAGFISAVVTPNAATGASCAPLPSGGTSVQLNCSIATLPQCTVNVNCPTILVTVRPGGEAGTRSNTARAISSVTADPNLGNNSGTANYSVTARADVTVSKTAPANTAAGQNLTYVVAASNLSNGLSSADAVTITDTLPANVTFISASPTSGSCGTTPTVGAVTAPGSDQVVCNLGTIGNGSQQTVTITVRPNNATRGTNITNNVAITTTTPETNTANNSASAATTITNPAFDLRMDKTETVDPVAVGEDTVYVLSVLNAGPSAVENMVVTDPLPGAGLGFRSVTAVGGTCTGPAVDSIGGTVTCNFGTVLSGGSRVVNITMRGVTKGSFTNTATVAADGSATFDTVPSNNTESEITTVRTRVDLRVTSKTATPGTVNLRDPFTFAIVVDNLVGPGLAESDGTLVSDTLPAGMQLTGTPSVAVNIGSATVSTCTGAAGGTSFTCDLGTFSNGGQVTITVPVRVISVASAAATVTNTASVSTTSRDINPGNNSNSGPVTVNSSSISGTVFRDFNNDALITAAADTGVGGISLTLTGASTDGTPIAPITVQTLSDGTYSFPLLPAGTYTVTRGTVSEAYLTNGTSTAGPNGGSASGVVISAISLPDATAAPGYLFPLIPQARIGLAKAVTVGPTVGADGSFTVTFRMTVRNPSLEALNTIALTDPLQGASPLFGTFAALGAPASDPMALGTYTILTAPSGSCGGANAGFNGAGNTTLASGFTLASGASCTVDVSLRVRPTAPVPPVLPSGGRYDNQATVDGVGALSGQTSATNPQLRDLSDNGANTDANANGQSNEAGENDPTPVLPVVQPSIALVKTANVAGLASPPAAGNAIVFGFNVTNTGNVTLTNITITDALVGLTNAPSGIASLAPGATATATLTASYTLLQADVDAGTVTNIASVNGSDPFATPVTDTSGTLTTNDLPLVVPLTSGPSITLIKRANASAVTSPAQVGQIISYTFEVKNTGNVTLSNVGITDALLGANLLGGPITLTPGQVDTTSFTGTYALLQADIDAGQVENTATVSGTPPTGAPVTDVSGTDATNDTPTVVLVGQAPAITLLKTVDDSATTDGATVGELLTYTFTVTNTGNVTLRSVTLADVLPGIVLSGGPIAQLNPGDIDTATFTAQYAIQASDITAGSVPNTATVTGLYGPGNTLSVTADSSAIASVLSVFANPEPYPPFTTDGGTTTSMLASDIYSGGQATLANVAITVLGASDPGITLNPATGLITLAPGLPAGIYTVDYQICAILVPTVCSTTTETVYQAPVGRLETTKTQAITDNGDGITGVGDTVTFTITVQNLSNTSVNNLTLDDTLTAIDGAAQTLDTGPDFVSADLGSPEGTLLINEIATYTATEVLTVNTVTRGGIRNTVTANALTVVPPGLPPSVVPIPVSDVSDDGIDTDGNVVNDPTEVLVESSLAPTGLTLTKTTPRGVVERGSVVPYTITVRNDNPVVSGQLNIVDVLPPGLLYVEGSATLDGIPIVVRIEGRVITFSNVPVPPLTTVVAIIQARVTTGAQAGELVNTATLRDPATNDLLARQATATVRILPEAVFDCGDVIGKVFEDRNRDGYQNPPRPVALGDPDAIGGGGKYGKYGGAPAVETDDGTEPGVPAVRLAGVDGTIITTDQFGRFHVPCAMLPADRGSNFILKIDTRSLPAGYRLTTENPRVVRLTPGKLTEMNFGVAISKVVRVDLAANAFVRDGDGNAALSEPLKVGIARLLPQITGEAVTLHLAYHLPPKAEAADIKRARALMAMVKRYVAQEWADVGRTKLTVEMTTVRSDE